MAGPSYLVTASEVATLQFAREVLKLPVPRVITWSGEKQSRHHSINPVGADYIIMDSIKLDERWMKFDSADDVAPVMTGISDAEARFESLRFSRIGSLYFKEDVSADLRDVSLFSSGAVDETSRRLSEKYCVGPLIDNQWWRGERAHMALDRGPCNRFAKQYIFADVLFPFSQGLMRPLFSLLQLRMNNQYLINISLVARHCTAENQLMIARRIPTCFSCTSALFLIFYQRMIVVVVLVRLPCGIRASLYTICLFLPLALEICSVLSAGSMQLFCLTSASHTFLLPLSTMGIRSAWKIRSRDLCL